MLNLLARRAADVANANVELPVYDERAGAFAALRDRRVLIYWPHGFGDFVHFSYVLPLLEPSNRYYIARFGDDFTHLYDGATGITPLFSGVRRPGDGRELGAPRHFGIAFKRIRNRPERFFVPEPLRETIARERIDALLYTDYPEPLGSHPFPYHTKARHLIGKLVDPSRLRDGALERPLRSALALHAPAQARALVEARLRTHVGSGQRLYVLSAGGHTQPDKVWPEADVLAFAHRLRERDERAVVLTVDERTSAEIGRAPGLAPTTTDLFGDLDLPFAHVLQSVIRAAHAYVGVASGPLHLALAIGERPIVGIWLAHWPGFFDEPCAHARHLVGPNVYRRGLDRRIGARTLAEHPAFRYDVAPFRDRAPGADDALDALAGLGAAVRA